LCRKKREREKEKRKIEHILMYRYIYVRKNKRQKLHVLLWEKWMNERQIIIIIWRRQEEKDEEKTHQIELIIVGCLIPQCYLLVVIVAAHDNFLGNNVSGVGISWPVTVSGTTGGVAILLLLLLLRMTTPSGLLAFNFPCAFATL